LTQARLQLGERGFQAFMEAVAEALLLFGLLFGVAIEAGFPAIRIDVTVNPYLTAIRVANE